jgi:hypothetical protein
MVQIDCILPSFPADLKVGFHSSFSATEYGAVLGVLGRQGDGEGVKWESREGLWGSACL